jgi:hypothetical protein
LAQASTQRRAFQFANGKAPIGQLTAVAAQLKDTSGHSTGIEPMPNPSPIKLAAGQGDIVSLTLSEVPGPGTYTSQIVLHATPSTDKPVDVTVKVRFGGLMLLVITVLGVALGWLVNVRLSTREAVDAARLAAFRASAAIGERAKVQKDPVVQPRLLGAAQSLEARLASLDSVDAIKAQTDAAVVLADRIEKQAADDAAQFAASVKKGEDILMPRRTA